MAELMAHFSLDKDVIRWVEKKMAEAMAAISQANDERDEARSLAREVLGHTKCECFPRRLPPDHWLFNEDGG